MRSEIANLYVKTYETKPNDYDVLDEIYMRFEVEKSMFISGIIEGGRPDLKDAKYTVEHLEKKYTREDGKVDRKKLKENQTYKSEMEYIKHVEEINKRYIEISLDGLYMRVSDLKTYLYFKNQITGDGYWVPFESTDNYNTIIGKLTNGRQYKEFEVSSSMTLVPYKNIGKVFWKNNILKDEVSFLLDNIESMFSNELDSVKYAQKSKQESNFNSNTLTMSSTTHTENVPIGHKPRTDSTSHSFTNGMSKASGLVTTVINDIKSNLIWVLDIPKSDYDDIIKKAFSTIHMELRRIYLMAF